MLLAATVGGVLVDPGSIRSGAGGWPAASPAYTLSPVELPWGTPYAQAGLGPHPCPQQARGLFEREPQDRFPQTLEVEVLEGAGWDRVPIVHMGKLRAGPGRGSPRAAWVSENDVGACREWISGGETGAAEGLRGLSMHVTGWGSERAHQPAGLCRWAEGRGKTGAWVGRAESV